MPLFLFLLLMLSSHSSFALSLQITNVGSNTPYKIISMELEKEHTVGEITIIALNKLKIPFEGSEFGILSMLGTPTGLDIHEVISDNHMKTYGWCYKVNNHLAEEMVNELILYPQDNDKIEWFYGFAEYLNGKWISFCTPFI